MALRAVFILATLKPSSGSFSHTEALSQLLIEKLKDNDVESEIVRLADHHIPPGLKTNMGEGDEWPAIVQKMFAADMVIFATPIWWGGHSSLMQRVIERMDELNDQLVDTGKSEFLNKVAGLVITGGEDGAQHVIGNLANFVIWNGFTLPPACTLSYLGDFGDSPEEAMKKLKSQDYTTAMATTVARNLVSVRKALMANPIPTQEKGSQFIR